jgi:protein SCO1
VTAAVREGILSGYALSALVRALVVALVLLAAPCVALAQPSGPMPKNIGFDPRFGEQAPTDAVLTDEEGRAVRLGDLAAGQRPTLLVLAYYECPMLCSMVMNGLVTALKKVDLEPGKDFEVVVVSIDPTDTPERARKKKATYVEAYGRPGAERGIHVLTGAEPEIRRVADGVGFRYEYDPVGKQYAHAGGAVVLSPDGKISRYFYGIDFAPRDLSLGLVEAADGKIGGARDRLLLLCYRYDPAQGKYGALALTSVRTGGVLTVALLGISILVMRRRSRKEEEGDARAP